MWKVLSRVGNLVRSRTLAGVDKSGNKYFIRKEEIDGTLKEKRWVIFKGEEDPTSVPVEWICWLNGQRKKAPTSEEMAEMEARRERVKLNVALLKKEEEERKARDGSTMQRTSAGDEHKEEVTTLDDSIDKRPSTVTEKERGKQQSKSVEPTGSGESFKPGTWKPPV